MRSVTALGKNGTGSVADLPQHIVGQLGDWLQQYRGFRLTAKQHSAYEEEVRGVLGPVVI